MSLAKRLQHAKKRHVELLLASLLTCALLLVGCQSSPYQPPPPQATNEGAVPLANAPAVVAPTATLLPASAWVRKSGAAAGVSYTLRVPPGWNSDLSYCVAGVHGQTSSDYLPPGCVVTDILAGPKAAGMGRLAGERLQVNGRQAMRQVVEAPSGMASRIYTVLLYNSAGTPFFGFSTLIGPGTDEATISALIVALDNVAANIEAEQIQ